MVKNNDERRFTGVFIPEKIWLDTNLSPIEKLFWGEVHALDKKEGCYARNEHFSSFFQITDRRVRQIIASLESKKYVFKFFDARNHRILRINHAALDTALPPEIFWKNPEPKAGRKKISAPEKNFRAGRKKISAIRDTLESFNNSPMSSPSEQAEKTRGEEDELRKFLNLFPEHRPNNPEKIAELAGLLRETLERESLTRQEFFVILKSRREIFERWTEKQKKYACGLRTILFSEKWKDDSFWQSRVSPEVRAAERAAQIADEQNRRELEAGEEKRQIRAELSPFTSEFFEICKAGKFRDRKTAKFPSLDVLDRGTFADFEEKIRNQYGERWEKYFSVFHEAAQRLKKEAVRHVA